MAFSIDDLQIYYKVHLTWVVLIILHGVSWSSTVRTAKFTFFLFNPWSISLKEEKYECALLHYLQEYEFLKHCAARLFVRV